MIYLTDMPRTTTRNVYRAFYRLCRIAARESDKAFIDTVIYGSGFVRVGTGRDGMEHVPIAEMFK